MQGIVCVALDYSHWIIHTGSFTLDYSHWIIYVTDYICDGIFKFEICLKCVTSPTYTFFFQSGVVHGGGVKRLARPSDISRAAKRCRPDTLATLTESATPPPELLEGKSEAEREIIKKKLGEYEEF